jgi:hypothetical protein
MKINKILAISINEYENAELNNIENCNNDVKEILSILTEKYSFDEVDYIYEKKDTTRKALYNKLNSYFINTLENENVLLIYAGHGEYNDYLETAYWQPSDSEPTDSSTWLNINEILAFIRVSKAFHISIISDSCFSGAIFEPIKRGGGIDAFSSKKSRLGLTSGGIEKVSDGIKGKLSPFTEKLTQLLKENEIEDLPFSMLSNNLILNFNPKKNQTPMFGALNNVGHDGGSFILKLKNKNTPIKIGNENNFLIKKLNNLFIKIVDEDLVIIKKINPINELKNKAIKSQKYEEAAKLRDDEKRLESLLFNNFPSKIEKSFKNIKISKDSIAKAQDLDEQTVNYKKLKQEKKEEIVKRQNEYKKIHDNDEEETENIKINLFDIWDAFGNIYGGAFLSNPETEFFNNEKDNFVKSYKESISKLYETFIKLKSNSKSEFLNNKLIELKEILIKIYKYEINLLVRGYNDELIELITLKEIEIEILKWIKNE